MNGPEPVYSSICLLGSVAATRLGIMNGTFEDGLPRASTTRPNGCESTMAKVLASIALISFVTPSRTWPKPSRAPQRLIEAMQSSEVTGVPSLHSSPSRSVMVQVSLSSETVYFSAICGWILRSASLANSTS